jgi:hypothetical protein
MENFSCQNLVVGYETGVRKKAVNVQIAVRQMTTCPYSLYEKMRLSENRIKKCFFSAGPIQE